MPVDCRTEISKHVDPYEKHLWGFKAEGDGFLQRISTADEIWVCYHPTETEKASKKLIPYLFTKPEKNLHTTIGWKANTYSLLG